MTKLRDLDIPQWAIILACGALAFLGQWLFVTLMSRSASTEVAIHELRQLVAVQRADFDASRKQMDVQFQQLQTQTQSMYAELTKRLDRLDARQEEMQRLLLSRGQKF